MSILFANTGICITVFVADIFETTSNVMIILFFLEKYYVLILDLLNLSSSMSHVIFLLNRSPPGVSI
jgi:hypothetical protein